MQVYCLSLNPCMLMTYWIFSISVAGGFFTGRYNSIDDAPEPGSRFDPNRTQGKVCLKILQIDFVQILCVERTTGTGEL